jgi:hypothetical protein
LSCLALTTAVLCCFGGQASAAPGALKILVVYSDLGTPPATLKADLAAQSGVASVDTFDAQAGTPTLPQLSAYDVVVAFSNSAFADAITLGNNLADYQDQGGVVVGVEFAFYGAPFGLDGRWITGGYSPYGSAGGVTDFSSATLGSHDASSPLLQGVNALSAFYRMTVTPAPGATNIANWSDGVSAVAVKGNAVGINAYLGDTVGNWSGDFARLIVNAGNVLGEHILTVTKAGGGTGTVTSVPAGINCGVTCQSDFANGSTVTLTAAAAPGSVFTGWSGGGCSGTGTCVVKLSANTPVTATFQANQTLTVATSGNGHGTVTSAPAGITCGATCSSDYAYGTSVTLSATPSSKSMFAGWSGDCSGKGSCTVIMSAHHSAVAAFQALCIVPNVKGKALAAANTSIRKAHCAVGKITKAFSATVKKGHVISQRPRPGARENPGASVKLTISKGRHG